MKIYLVRHPETVANRDGIIYGWKDYPYTEKGQAMYENIPKYFLDKGVEKIFSSPLGRAEKLARAISETTKIDLKTDDRLKEMNFGILEGTTFDALDEIQKKLLDKMFSDFDNFQVPGGESGAILRKRGKEFFQELLENNKSNDTVVVVAHAMLIQMGLINLLGLDTKKAWSFRMKPGMIISLKAKREHSYIEEMLNYETLFPDSL